MKPSIAFFVFIFLMLFRSEAQEIPSFYPFKGFHVGITGQAQFIQKPIFSLHGSDPAPKGTWSYGWEVGMEFSWHFAKYFGVSVGINYGTALSYDCAIYWRTIPGYNDVWGVANDYEDLRSPMQDEEIMFPIKFEFHYPLHKKLFFTAEAGVKFKGIFNRMIYGNRKIKTYTHTLSYEETDIFFSRAYRDISKIRCDLLVGLGFYYKFAHGDLLRFIAGINYAFSPDLVGEYMYLIPLSGGNFFVKNDFFYTQISYIHTLNWQKAKRYLKKQEYSFSSKKERREKIYELF